MAELATLIGNRLRAAREDAELNQEEVAKAFGRLVLGMDTLSEGSA